MYAELERKTCPRCKNAKDEKEFGKDATTARGISSWCKDCKRKWRSDHRKKYPEKAKLRDLINDLKKNYGISLEQYQKMRKQHKRRCACCGMHEARFKRKLHIDHDHRTGEIRGLLCTRCNPGIGYFDHSIERLNQAIAYLSKFKK